MVRARPPGKARSFPCAEKPGAPTLAVGGVVRETRWEGGPRGAPSVAVDLKPFKQGGQILVSFLSGRGDWEALKGKENQIFHHSFEKLFFFLQWNGGKKFLGSFNSDIIPFTCGMKTIF